MARFVLETAPWRRLMIPLESRLIATGSSKTSALGE
jgi:hypothetical protein